jgi:hypothetical protein
MKIYLMYFFFLQKNIPVLFIKHHGRTKNTRSNKNDIHVHRPPSDNYKHCSEPKTHRRHRPSLTAVAPQRTNAPVQQPPPMKRGVDRQDPPCRPMNADERRPDLRGSTEDKHRPNSMRTTGDAPPHAFQRREMHRRDGARREEPYSIYRESPPPRLPQQDTNPKH